MKYASLMRSLSKIFEEMHGIAWTEIPVNEFEHYEEAYRAVKNLLKNTDIPINIDDK